MTWRSRIIFVAAATVLGAVTWVAQPYWDSAMRAEETVRGRLARKQRANDTFDDAMGRAALGGGVGLACGLLAFTVRNHHQERGRRLHWTGLEIPDK